MDGKNRKSRYYSIETSSKAATLIRYLHPYAQENILDNSTFNCNSQYIFNTTDSQECKDVNFCNNSEVNLVEDPREYPVDMAWQGEE